ncbi:P-loop containing nucleoside triphosphate hydrolase protein [Blastocladiella britannica]|nr:P-loop containing nucleoside triphosphate hydrolase protein [Blastocladiella britannica]
MAPAQSKRDCPITVAVRIRPAPTMHGADPSTHAIHQTCVHQVEERNQIMVSFDAAADFLPSGSQGAPPRAFTFDHAFGTSAVQQDVYDTCVRPLLEPVSLGFNATILAYGQTGSGKTFTMGTCPSDGMPADQLGLAPRLVEELLEKLPDVNQRLVRVSYIELYQEEVRDLLDPESRADVAIREDRDGNIVIQGVEQIVCQTKEDILGLLEKGSMARTVGETNMNNASSRSHAIFSLYIEQYVMNTNDKVVECRTSKLHLVDLAGSERQKRTGADGLRFKESIKINSGLLALGNVINALAGTGGGRTAALREGIDVGNTAVLQHVPYRDSKLTRLLQDSLGGNSKTVLIACVSPMAGNAQESLNTLVYANRAKRIKNRPMPNLGIVAASTQPPTPAPVRAQDSPAVRQNSKRIGSASAAAAPTGADESQGSVTTDAAVAAELLGLVEQLKAGLLHANAMVKDMVPPPSVPSSPPTAASEPELAAAVAAALMRPSSSSKDESTLVRELERLGVQVRVDPQRLTNGTRASNNHSREKENSFHLPAVAGAVAMPSLDGMHAPWSTPPARRSARSRTPATHPLAESVDVAQHASVLARLAELDRDLASRDAALELLTAQLEAARTNRSRSASSASTSATRNAERLALAQVREAETMAAYHQSAAREAVAAADALRNALVAATADHERVINEQAEAWDRERQQIQQEAAAWHQEAIRLQDALSAAELAKASVVAAAAIPASAPAEDASGESQSLAPSTPPKELEEELVRLTVEMEDKLRMIDELNTSRQRTANLSQKFHEKMSKLERELAGAEKQVEKLRSEKIDLDSEKNRQKHEYESKIESINSQLTALRSRQKQHDKLLREKETKERQISDLQTEVDKMRDRHAQLQRRARAESERLASAEAVHASSIKNLQKQHVDDTRRIKVLEGQIVALRKRVDSGIPIAAVAKDFLRIDSAASLINGQDLVPAT